MEHHYHGWGELLAPTVALLLERVLMFCRICGFVAVGLVFLTGCGPGLNLVPVEGTVTLDGKPLAGKSIMFSPESGNGTSAGGNTDDAGKYKLVSVVPGTTTDQVGAVPGKYKVTVFEPLIPINAKVDEGTDTNPGPGLVPQAVKKSTIPLKYQNVTSTPLVLEVPAAGGTLNIELKSGG